MLMILSCSNLQMNVCSDLSESFLKQVDYTDLEKIQSSTHIVIQVNFILSLSTLVFNHF